MVLNSSTDLFLNEMELSVLIFLTKIVGFLNIIFLLHLQTKAFDSRAQIILSHN